MKYRNRIVGLVFCALLLCTLSVTAYADDVVPDENRKGEITIEMRYDGKAITGGILAAYRVGQVHEDDGNFRFEKTAPMEKFSGDYSHINDPELAEDVYAFVQEHSIQPDAKAENEAGKATFSHLELGLYLIVQTEASEGYEPLKPFLVTVPMNDDGHYVYEVTATGKFELHQEPKPTTPAKPPEPTLPQTGQLNWPIPVMAALGLCLFAMGWALRFGKKKSRYEK